MDWWHLDCRLPPRRMGNYCRTLKMPPLRWAGQGFHRRPVHCQCSPVAARGRGHVVAATAVVVAVVAVAVAAEVTAVMAAAETAPAVAAAAAPGRKRGRQVWRLRSPTAVHWTPGGKARSVDCPGPNSRCHLLHIAAWSWGNSWRHLAFLSGWLVIGSTCYSSSASFFFFLAKLITWKLAPGICLPRL